jgi:hypothetical protein
MSIPLDLRQEALAVLRTKSNPFEQFARPQFADGRFEDLHRPELLHGPRQTLLAMIDAYRVHDGGYRLDLPPTRVVTVRGPRGSGKTHLLESLDHVNDGKPRVVVRPHLYPADMPFEEYLLGQIHTTLTGPDALHTAPPFLQVAEQLTRRLLLQAVRSLSPVERVFARSPRGLRSLRLLFGGGERYADAFDALARSLAEPADERPLPEVVREHGVAPEQCLRIVYGHLKSLDAGSSLQFVTRRELYLAIAGWSLLRDRESLLLMLEGGHAAPEKLSVSRADVVRAKLNCLIEACTLAGLPIVIAVDNLEKMFRPLNEIDKDLVRGFTENVAHAVDELPGLLFLVFAEQSFFQQYLVSNLSTFSQSRWMQKVVSGVHSYDAVIDLKMPTYEDLHILITARVAQALGDFPQTASLPDLFPFPPDFVKTLKVETSRQLRDSLILLRDAYEKEVHTQQPTPVIIDALIAWKQKLVQVGDTLADDKWYSHRQKFHEGLGTIFQKLIGSTVGGWIIRRADPTIPVGDSPTLGFVTALQLEAARSEDATAVLVAVGLFLHRSNFRANDLQAKLDAFKSKRHKFERLVILWPESPEGGFTAEALGTSTRTREIWDGAGKVRDLMEVRRFDVRAAKMLLAFPGWLTLMQDEQSEPLSEDQVREFVLEHCRPLINIVLPALKPVEAAVP